MTFPMGHGLSRLFEPSTTPFSLGKQYNQGYAENIAKQTKQNLFPPHQESTILPLEQ